jgi:hypothetical protein
MKTSTFAASFAAVITAACADTGPTRERDPSGIPAAAATAQCAHNPGYQRSDNCCILPSYVSPLDADMAFTRAMKAYRFPTKVDANGSRNPARIYRYQSVKGQYHSAANDVTSHGEHALDPGVWLFLTIERETDSSSSVSAAYCETPGRRPANPAAWHAAVQQSIRATVPPK